MGRQSTIDFKPLTDKERKGLMGALAENAAGRSALLMDKSTTFIGHDGGALTGDITDDEVVDAIKSVPVHYEDPPEEEDDDDDDEDD